MNKIGCSKQFPLQPDVWMGRVRVNTTELENPKQNFRYLNNRKGSKRSRATRLVFRTRVKGCRPIGQGDELRGACATAHNKFSEIISARQIPIARSALVRTASIASAIRAAVDELLKRPGHGANGVRREIQEASAGNFSRLNLEPLQRDFSIDQATV
jgi:hypothetical protein